MKRARNLIIMLIVVLLLAGAYLLVTALTKEETSDKEAIVGYEISTLNPETINKLSFTVGEETLSFEKIGETWKWSTEINADVDSEAIAKIAATAAGISGLNRIQNVTEDRLSEYGLLNPTLYVSASDGAKSQEFYFGSYNGTVDAYYLTSTDYPSTVFTVIATARDAFDITIEDLIVKEVLPSIDADNLQSAMLELDGSNIAYTVIKIANPDSKGEDDKYIYSAKRTINGIDEKYSYADLYRFAEAIEKWELGELVSYTRAEADRFGFDKPAKLTVNYTDEREYDGGEGASNATIKVDESFTLILGDYNDEGYFYCKTDEVSPFIYKLPYKEFSELFGKWQ